jgi:hypothetical protein
MLGVYATLRKRSEPHFSSGRRGGHVTGTQSLTPPKPQTRLFYLICTKPRDGQLFPGGADADRAVSVRRGLSPVRR